MFFILSKLLTYFIAPFNWLLLFIILAFFIKNEKWKKRFKWLAIGWFFFFSNPLLIHHLNLKWQVPARTIAPGEQYEAGIVLGGFVQFDAKEKKGYFNSASDRFLQAVRLYKMGHIKKIAITGGSGKLFHTEYRDADFAKDQLLEFGIPLTDIILENNSRNTYENAVFTKTILDSSGIKGPYLLITSAMHMRRSEQVFKKVGLPVVAYPANFATMDFPLGFTDAIKPSISAMNDWESLLKEVIGLQVYKWTGKA
ncbi:MAG: YdcF family protein [Chitinophagaceae bacterium]|nr:MAG: YdcF family protein [Chitinophagaceae bacterium]